MILLIFLLIIILLFLYKNTTIQENFLIIDDCPSYIPDAVCNSINGITNTITTEINSAKNTVKREIQNDIILPIQTTVSNIQDDVSRQATRIENSATSAARGVVGGIRNDFNSITDGISREVTRVEGEIENTAGRLVDVAKDDIKGVTDGISREVTRVEGEIENKIDEAEDIFNRDVVRPIKNKIDQYVDIWKRRYENITSITTDVKDIMHEIQNLMKSGFMLIKDTIIFTVTTGEIIYLMFKKAESCSNSAKLIINNIESHMGNLEGDLDIIKEKIQSCTNLSRFLSIRGIMNFNDECIKVLMNGNDHLKQYVMYIKQVFQNNHQDLSHLPKPLDTLLPPNDETYLQMTPSQKNQNYTYNICSNIRKKGHQQRLDWKNTRQYKECIQRKSEDLSFDIHTCINNISHLKGPELRRFETWEYAKNCNQCLNFDGLLSRSSEELNEINDMVNQITMVIGLVDDLYDTINLLKSNIIFTIASESSDEKKQSYDALLRQQLLETNGYNRIPSGKTYIQHKTDIVNRCNQSAGDSYSPNNQKLNSIINNGIREDDLFFGTDIITGIHAGIKAGTLKPYDWILQDNDELGNIDYKGKLKNKSTTECSDMRLFLQREQARNLRSKTIQDTGIDPWEGKLKSTYPLNTNILSNELPDSHPLSQRSISSRQQMNRTNTIAPLNLPQR